jgi:hypothetical protein
MPLLGRFQRGDWAGVCWPRTAARCILLAWTAFWVWFGLASGLSRHLPPLGLTLHVATPALIFAMIAVLAARHGRLAGWLLIAIALAILFEYNELMGHRGAFFVLRAGSIISGPPLIAGSLFLLAASSAHSQAPDPAARGPRGSRLRGRAGVANNALPHESPATTHPASRPGSGVV